MKYISYIDLIKDITVRGKLKTPKTLTLSGKIFLEIEDEEEILAAEKGDLLFRINIDAQNYETLGDYRISGYKGFFRISVYDGKSWFYLSPTEFFEHKENYFAKNEYPYNCYLNCKEIMEKFKGETLYKSYRDHYTRFEYEPNDFKGKKGNKYKKDAKPQNQ